MNYAVIRTGGKQYRVTPGCVLRIERLTGDVGTTVEFPEVLLAGSDDVEAPVHIGTPLVAGTVVRAEITAQGRDRKIWSTRRSAARTTAAGADIARASPRSG
jgi:large subunit ribosomal protein L21